MSGCAAGGTSGAQPPPASHDRPAATTTTGARPADRPNATATDPTPAGVLAFRAATVDGGVFDGAALAGRDVALWFWAPW